MSENKWQSETGVVLMINHKTLWLVI